MRGLLHMRGISFHYFLLFSFSSRRRHTRCALVTGLQSCALPILNGGRYPTTCRLIPYSLSGVRSTANSVRTRNGHCWSKMGCSTLQNGGNVRTVTNRSRNYDHHRRQKVGSPLRRTSRTTEKDKGVAAWPDHWRGWRQMV